MSVRTTPPFPADHLSPLQRRGCDDVAEAPFNDLAVDGEQLCLSPQRGLASTWEGDALTPEDQLAKLRLVVETAADVWG